MPIKKKQINIEEPEQDNIITKEISPKKQNIRFCEECNTETINYMKNGLILCQSCSNLDKYKYIYKNTAITEYMLHENDLLSLNYIETKNPHYSSAEPMKLYTLADVKLIFMNKYNIKHKYTKNSNIPDDKIKDIKDRVISDNKTKLFDIKINRMIRHNKQIDLFEKLLAENCLTNEDHNLTEEYIKKCTSISKLVKKISDISLRIRNFKDKIIIHNLSIKEVENAYGKKIFNIFFGDDDINNININNAHNNANNNTDEKIIERALRITLLTEELARYNLIIEDDSQLCVSYIEHGVGNPANIALIMKQLEWLYKNTKYNDIVEIMYKEKDIKNIEDKIHEAKIKAIKKYIQTRKEPKIPYYMDSLMKFIKN